MSIKLEEVKNENARLKRELEDIKRRNRKSPNEKRIKKEMSMQTSPKRRVHKSKEYGRNRKTSNDKKTNKDVNGKIYARFARRALKERNKRGSARRKLNYVSEHNQREQEAANSSPRPLLQKELSTLEKKKKKQKVGVKNSSVKKNVFSESHEENITKSLEV